MDVALYDFAVCRDLLGPGRRVILWFQGCSLACPGCMTPDAMPRLGGRWTRLRAIQRYVRKVQPIEGLTISGGEPFQQASALAQLLGFCKQANLGSIVYSGYTLRELERRSTRDADVRSALGLADTIIDGRYDHSNNTGVGIRGSVNQKVHMLSDRYSAFAERFENDARRQEHIFRQTRTLTVGLATIDRWQKVNADQTGLTGYHNV